MKRRTLSLPPPHHQRGIVAVMAVIILITAVIFALSQTVSMNGSNSTDNKQQLDSTAALFLAESGLERAKAILAISTATNSTCTNIGASGSFTLGRGTFKYLSATSEPLSCSNGSCTKCIVDVVGTVGSTTRTLQYGVNLIPTNGISGFGTNVSISLKNSYTVPASVIFELGWRRAGGTAGQIVGNGNADASICSGCGLKWYVESASGQPSAGSMGSAYTNIAAGGTSPMLTQTISSARNYAEVGAYFPGLTIGGVSTAPKILDSYWNGESGGGGNKTYKTVNANTSSGETNSGVANAGACLLPQADSTAVPKQTCTSWCYGTNNNADTLVFGVSSRSDSVAEEITNVIFNTNGSPSQNTVMTKIAHFPNTDSTTASGDIYAEIWKTYNPAYPPLSTGPGATSFSQAVFGTIGANITGTIGANIVGQVGSIITNPIKGRSVNCSTGANSSVASNCVRFATLCSNCTVSVQDLLTSGGILIGAISAYNSVLDIGTFSGTPKLFGNNTSFTTTSRCLNIASVSTGIVSLGDTVPIGANTTISALGGSSCSVRPGLTTYLLSGISPTNNQAGNPTTIQSTNLIASAAPTYGRLIFGDSVSGTTISNLNSLNGLTAGTYILSSAVGPTSGIQTISSSKLIFNHKTATDFVLVALNKGDGVTAVGANISGSRTTETTVSPNYEYYPLSTSLSPVDITPQWFTQGASGTAITLPNGTIAPTAGTIVAVYSGAGLLPAKTKVLVSPTSTPSTFTLSAVPTTALNGAQLCGGICALFNNPSSALPTNVTQFKVTDTSTHNRRWAGGFTCLTGVDDSLIKPVTSSATSSSDWSELVK